MHQYLIILLSTNLWNSETAKILSIAPVHSRSHNSIHQTILQELVSRGHQVTSISYFKSNINSTNYEEIMIEPDTGESFIDTVDITAPDKFVGFWNLLFFGQEMENTMCLQILRNDYVQKLIHSKLPPVDLIISEPYYTKCYNLLAHKLNIPLITVSPTSSSPGIDNFLGNSFNPSHVPLWINGCTSNMNFFQRLINTIQYTIYYWYQFFMYDTNIEGIVAETLNMPIPSDDILSRRVALAFYNSHSSFLTRPLTPNVKEIAGIHIKDPKPLPKDILEFIETAQHGVIFFSFGTTIQASSMPKDKVEILLQVFSTIPQKVLWRVNKLNVDNLPPNVKIGRWFPQRDILEHKNVVVFISHCGLFGTLEAIHTATPVLAMPFYFDQPQNAKILVEKEVAVYLDFDTMDKGTLINAIREITTDEKYKNNMKNLSKIFRNRPISPLSTVIYWIEYVIEHKEVGHLRTRGADLPLYKYLLLDVVAFITATVILVIYLTERLIRTISTSIRSNKFKIKSN